MLEFPVENHEMSNLESSREFVIRKFSYLGNKTQNLSRNIAKLVFAWCCSFFFEWYTLLGCCYGLQDAMKYPQHKLQNHSEHGGNNQPEGETRCISFVQDDVESDS